MDYVFMHSQTTDPAATSSQRFDKSSPGRGYVVVIYGLYIGSIMAVVTAPLGALIAYFRIGRGDAWLDTHLRFQVRTFVLGLIAAAIALLLWRAVGKAGLEPIYAWAFGYLFFTAGVAWMMARCGVGLHRLTSNRAIDKPGSLLFGVGKKT